MRLRVINFETFFCVFFYESAFRKANFGIDLKITITETDNHLRPREESVNKQLDYLSNFNFKATARIFFFFWLVNS